MPTRDPEISVVIVDDEPLGRELVRHLLSRYSDIRVVAECGDGEKALAAIKRHAPQLVFLDIKMPRLDGMSLLERLEPATRPLVVFITAHDTYAIRAFEAHAFDYLLKPFDQERFDETLRRVREHLTRIAEATLGKNIRQLLAEAPATPAGELATPAATNVSTNSFLERIVIRESGRVYFVDVNEISWLEASGNYVALHVASGKTHLVHDTMTSLETKLDPALFVRIHRSTIVRLERIRELQPHFNGEYVVLLKDDSRLKLSRSYLEKARRVLGLD